VIGSEQYSLIGVGTTILLAGVCRDMCNEASGLTIGLFGQQHANGAKGMAFVCD